MYYKIAQLILTPGAKASTTSEIFVAQPDANKEELAGKLFALIEIESKKASDLKIINFIIESLHNNYYQNEKMILRERVKTVKIEHIFESALAKTNKNLAEFIHAEKIKFAPKSMNAIVGVIYKNKLHFASVGKNKAFLVYKNHLQTETAKEYGITDIIKQSETGEKKTQINLPKIFSSVISGSMPEGGYFIFTNEALPEYLSTKKLKEIVVTLPPTSAAEQIKNALTKVNYYVSFLGLIIKNTTGHELRAVKPNEIVSDTNKSVSNLNKMEENTEELLAPSGIINFKKWFNKLIGSFSAPKSKLSSGAISAATLKDKIFFKKETHLLKFKKAWLYIKNIAGYTIYLFIYLFKLITDKEKLKELIEKIKSAPAAIKAQINKFIAWFQGLSIKNKILFVIAFSFLFLFIQNLTISSFKNNQIEKKGAYEDLVKPIEQKQNQVEASLLYGNEDGARSLLNEIKELLAGLPQKTSDQIETYNELFKKYEEQLEKIRHVVKIESLNELANFSNLNVNANPINITLAPNGKIYTGDSNEKTIYSLDLAGGLITAIAKTGQEIKTLEYPSVSSDGDIYYFNVCVECSSGSNIIHLDPKTENIDSISIELLGDPKNIVTMANYNNRLYLLNKLDGQIYRYNKRPEGFADIAPWIKGIIDLSDAVSMSIDTHLYLLKKDGQLIKYLSGEEQEFKLDIVEPALKEAKKVIISEEAKYIYILEPINKRLVVFDKTGNFLMQYQIDQFNDLKDFAINEKDKKIYFLNGSSIFEITGEHFEK